MMGLEKHGDKYIFQSGKYEGVSLGNVLNQYEGRGWLIDYALYSGFKLVSEADAAIIEKELARFYINDARQVLAECRCCGAAVPHNRDGCVTCQLAKLEGAVEDDGIEVIRRPGVYMPVPCEGRK